MKTYKIIRFYDRINRSIECGVSVKNRTIKKGLTLKEAQAHCQRDDTSGVKNGTRWFDGYTEEVVS